MHRLNLASVVGTMMWGSKTRRFLCVARFTSPARPRIGCYGIAPSTALTNASASVRPGASGAAGGSVVIFAST